MSNRMTETAQHGNQSESSGLEKVFTKLGRRLGTSVQKGKWYYQSAFGSEVEAIRAERRLGRELAKNIRSEHTMVSDATMQRRLDDIGGCLRKRVVNKEFRFSYELIASSDINAFALPGGFIFVTWGLYDWIQDAPDEMAFVLAHEMMHVVLKHPMKRILANYSSQIIANVLLRGGALGMLGKQIVHMLLSSGYSRDREYEADQYAVRLMHAADFDPVAAISLFEKLRATAPEDLPVYNYFLSHPAMNNRIQYIREIIQTRQLQ